jgi:hypothetical protein
MIKRIINRYFKDYRSSTPYTINLGTCTIHLKSPTLWIDIWRSLKEEFIFKYYYYFYFKTATVPLKEIKGKWDHVPCKHLCNHNELAETNVSSQKKDEGYRWNELKKSLLNSKTYGCLYIKKFTKEKSYYKEFTSKGYRYRVVNGNHRIALLKCIYGLEHKIKIKYVETNSKAYKILNNEENITETIPINSGKTFLKVQPIKVKLSEIEHDYPNATLENLEDTDYLYKNKLEPYPWRAFIEDIRKNGLKNKPILTLKSTSFFIKDPHIYSIFNGNHRIKALELIYGKDAEIDLYILIEMQDNIKLIEKMKKIKKEEIKSTITNRLQIIKNKHYDER